MKKEKKQLSLFTTRAHIDLKQIVFNANLYIDNNRKSQVGLRQQLDSVGITKWQSVILRSS